MTMQQPGGAFWAHLLDATGAPVGNRASPPALGGGRSGPLHLRLPADGRAVASSPRATGPAKGSPAPWTTSWPGWRRAASAPPPRSPWRRCRTTGSPSRGNRVDVGEQVTEACDLLAQQVIDEARSKYGQGVDSWTVSWSPAVAHRWSSTGCRRWAGPTRSSPIPGRSPAFRGGRGFRPLRQRHPHSFARNRPRSVPDHGAPPSRTGLVARGCDHRHSAARHLPHNFVIRDPELIALLGPRGPPRPADQGHSSA